MNRLGALLITTIALISSGCEDGSASPEDSQSVAAEQTFTASGVLTLTLPMMSDSISGNLELCQQQMPVVENQQVTIENSKLEVVGFGSLSAITFEPDDGTCRRAWTAEEVPATSGVLALRVGDFKPIYFKQTEAERGLVSAFPDMEVP